MQQAALSMELAVETEAQATATRAQQLRLRRRRLRSLLRQAVGVGIVLLGCLAGMLIMGRRVLQGTSERELELTASHTRALSSGGEDACANLASWETNGGIMLYIAGLGYIFIALAIICDDYFVTSLEKISDALGLSSDVAGATFMAAGSSAPELFVSLADNVFTRPTASMGVGTIVGSAIFNILIIIALSGMLAGQVLFLDWRPLLRDSLWYTWSIAVLSLAVWDGEINILDSIIMVVSYVGYIIYMAFNEKIIKRFCNRPEEESTEKPAEPLEEGLEKKMAGSAPHVEAFGGSAAVAVTTTRDSHESKSSRVSSREESQHSSGRGFLGEQAKGNPMHTSKYRMFQSHPKLQRMNSRGELVDLDPAMLTGSGGRSSVGRSSVGRNSVGCGSGGRVSVQAAGSGGSGVVASSPEVVPQRADKAQASDAATVAVDPAADHVELSGYFEEMFDMPASCMGKMWFIFTWPIVAIARVTVPDCRYPIFSRAPGYSATFAMSIVWIGVLSHYTVEFATKFGCIAGIPSSLMGLTIIAAGTSIPDAMSSVLVARAGQGDMAVSNALGSNVFDILLGLGFPFLLSNLVYSDTVPVSTDDLATSIIILFGVVVFVVGMLVLSRWRLYPKPSAFLLVLYLCYVIYSYLHGMGII